MAKLKIPGIPAILGTIPKEIQSVLRPMKEILQAFTDPTNPVLRVQTLVDAGIVGGYNPGNGTVTPGSSQELDTTPPPAPTGLTAGGALANIILSWDAATTDNLAHTEIWRAETDDISVAVKIGTAPGQVYVDPLGSGAVRYYWIRYLSRAGTPGPFNAQAGVMGETGYDAGYLIDVLAANPPEGADFNPLLYQQPADIVIDGVTIPAGVYMSTAYIRKLSVANAMIGNLAVDNAKIADLDAVKITAGDIHADRMTANIVTAMTGRFNSLSAITANLGTVTIDSSGFLISSGVTSYGSGIGFWLGYSGGAYKFRIGDPNGQCLKWDGTNLTLTGALLAATGTFSGSLSAATGTFAGSLSAATGTFSGSLSAATGTFAGSLSAATGTFSGSLNAASGSFSGSLTAQTVQTDNIVSDALSEADIWTSGAANGTLFSLSRASKVLVVVVYSATDYTPTELGSGWVDVGVSGNFSARVSGGTSGLVTAIAFGTLAAGTHSILFSGGAPSGGSVSASMSRTYILKMKK